jgi:hypothetical protein
LLADDELPEEFDLDLDTTEFTTVTNPFDILY